MSLQLTKSRRNLLLVVGAFIVPVILAKLALEQHWFNYGVTNHGHLIEQPITLADMEISEQAIKEQWLLLYRVPEQCEQLCRQTMLAVNNTYILLGSEIPRVTPVALYQQAFSSEVDEPLHHKKWQKIHLPESAQRYIDNAQLLIVDPLGNVVMSYDGPSTEQNLPDYSKAILADMKKLLKYSRIG